jgi:3-methylcrotonyl-CoA carboxylase alpha subunit
MAAKPGQIEVDGKVITAAPAGDGCWTLTTDTGIERAWAVGSPERSWVFYDGRVYILETFKGRQAGREQLISNTLSAPMPATVRTVLVKVGDEVKEGQTLVVLEAMKMELALRAHKPGRVTEIRCTPGELVEPGVPLVELS